MTLLTQSTRRPRRLGRLALLVGLGTLALGSGATMALALAAGLGQPAGDPLRLLPRGGLIYAEANFQAHGEQGAAWRRVVGAFTAKPGHDAALRALLGTDPANKKNVQAALDTLGRLGNHTEMALFAGRPSHGQSQVNELFVLTPGQAGGSDPLALLGTLKDIAQNVRPAGLYRGHVLTSLSLGGAPFYATIAGGNVAMATSNTPADAEHLLRAALDAADGQRPSLATSSAYQATMATLPPARLGVLYIASWAGLVDLLNPQIGPATGSASAMPTTQITGQAFAALPPMALALQAQRGGLRLVSSSVALPAVLGVAAPVTTRSAQFAAPDAVAYVTVRGPGPALLSALRLADRAQGHLTGAPNDLLHTSLGLAAIERRLGLNVERDVLPLLGGDLGVSASLDPSASAGPLGAIDVRAALALTDPAATGRVMTRVNAWIPRELGLPWTRIAPDVRGMQTLPAGIGYKMTSSWLLAGTGIAHHWAGGLQNTAAFRAGVGAVADTAPGGAARPTSLWYINLDPLRGLLDVSGTAQPGYTTLYKPWLDALHTMSLATRVGHDGRQSMALFVGVN